MSVGNSPEGNPRQVLESQDGSPVQRGEVTTGGLDLGEASQGQRGEVTGTPSDGLDLGEASLGLRWETEEVAHGEDK